jgi:hypothetical protein
MFSKNRKFAKMFVANGTGYHFDKKDNFKI